MKKILLAVFAIFFAATAFSVPAIPPAYHFVDGNQLIISGLEITTAHPAFEYKVQLNNSHNSVKSYQMHETISNKLTLLGANLPYSTIVNGEYNEYVFDNVSVPAYGDTNVIMHFKNETTNEQKAVSINTSFCELLTGDCFNDFQFFIFNANVPAIPEFGFFLIPVGAVLGSYFFINKKKMLA